MFRDDAPGMRQDPGLVALSGQHSTRLSHELSGSGDPSSLIVGSFGGPIRGISSQEQCCLEILDP